jgi:hypothetical protein
MKIHVFYYRWPRIMEGLTHVEYDARALNELPAGLPEGTFIWCWAAWFIKKESNIGGTTFKPMPVYRPSEEKAVPKPIRLLKLVVT